MKIQGGGGLAPLTLQVLKKHLVKHVTDYLFQLHQEAVKTLIWQFPNFKHSDCMTFQVLEQQNKTALILWEWNGQVKVLLSKNIS